MQSEAAKESERQIVALFDLLDKKKKEIEVIEQEIRIISKIYSREMGYIVPLSTPRLKMLVDEYNMRKRNATPT